MTALTPLISETQKILRTLLLQMNEAETVEDCILFVEDMISQNPDIELHDTTDIALPDNMNGPSIPPGDYDRAALGNANGFRIHIFQPVHVDHADTLQITWRINEIRGVPNERH